MTNLLSALRASNPDGMRTSLVRPLGMEEWSDWFKFNNMAFPLFGNPIGSEDSESIPNNFEQYVQAAFLSDPVVFSVMLTRMLVFTEAQFMYQRLVKGRGGGLWSDPGLNIMEQPWINGRTGDLLAKALFDTDLSGNNYGIREATGGVDNGPRIRRLRPDWVQIILSAPPAEAIQSDVVGILYQPGGFNASKKVEPKLYTMDRVAHWAPIPDPLAEYRGVSWLSAVWREIMSDIAATKHKHMFFKNAATPNLVISLKDEIGKDEFKQFRKDLEAGHRGVENAYKNLYLGCGADVTVVGLDMKAMDFKSIQGAIETRIATTGRVHPVLVGLSEGLAGSSLNSGNFTTAKDWFGSATMRPLWRSFANAYENIVPVPKGNRLWYDDRDIAALRADRKDVAQTQSEQATVISKLITAGYEPDSIVAAVEAQDWTLLVHSGLMSVQLIPPGTANATPKNLNLPSPVMPEADGQPADQQPVGSPNGKTPAAPPKAGA